MLRTVRAFAATAVVALVPALAVAQTEQTTSDLSGDTNASAKKLMAEGNALYAKRDFEGAHQKFLEAWAIKQHSAIASNLVETEMKLGRYGEAASRLRSLLSTLPMDDKDERTAFMVQLDECRHHLVALHINVNVDGATVKINNSPIGTAPLASEVLVEPGTTKIDAELAGYEATAEWVRSAAAGEAKTVTLNLTKKTPVTPVVVQTAPRPRPGGLPRRENVGEVSATRNFVTIGGVVLTATAATLGIIYWQNRRSAKEEADRLRDGLARNSCYPGAEVDVARCQGLQAATTRYYRDTNIMNGMFVAGGVTAVATVLTYLLWPTSKAAPANASSVKTALIPWSGSGSVGLQLNGGF